MNARAASREGRVVVVLDAAAAELSLELARHFAGSTAAELLGVFVEDTRLLEHARSRLALEVMLSGGSRPLDLIAVEGRLRNESARARALLEATAARFGLRGTFEIVRGEPAVELARRASAAEGLVVGLKGTTRHWQTKTIEELLRAPLPALLLAREGWSAGGSVMAVIDDPAAAEPLFEAAASIAAASGSRLLVLLVGKARDRQVRAQVEAAALPLGTAVFVDVVSNTLGAAALARAARSRDVRLLVMRVAALPVSDVSELLVRAPSALLLIGTRDGAFDPPSSR